MRIIRVNRTEFETEDGSVFPIEPPLEEDLTPDEFQEHYDFAAAFVQGSRPTRSNDQDTEDVGQDGKDPGSKKPRRA